LLATDPTGTGEPDVLLIGDLNSYAKEDPLTAFADAGYTNLVVEYEGFGNYSYVFDGLAGSLDHALASSSLVDQVTDTETWHINADEPPILDYNVEFKTPGHVQSFYDPGPFRSSDHDPVVIGLELGGTPVQPTVQPTTAPTREPTVGPTVEATTQATAGPTQAPTTTPSDQTGGGNDQNNSTGGVVAIIIGAAAVLLALVASLVGLAGAGVNAGSSYPMGREIKIKLFHALNGFNQEDQI
jgi:hypothetical protein